LESLAIEYVEIFIANFSILIQMVYFMAIWYFCGYLVYFSLFWCVAPTKIRQPCTLYLTFLEKACQSRTGYRCGLPGCSDEFAKKNCTIPFFTKLIHNFSHGKK
jgi:hypothetical protein